MVDSKHVGTILSAIGLCLICILSYYNNQDAANNVNSSASQKSLATALFIFVLIVSAVFIFTIIVLWRANLIATTTSVSLPTNSGTLSKLWNLVKPAAQVVEKDPEILAV